MAVNAGISTKSRMVDAILCWFLGVFGAHKFYEGKVGMGILYIFTIGLFGIGALVDFIIILCGAGRDSDGLPIKQWLDDQGTSCGETVSSSNQGTSLNAEQQCADTLAKYKDLLDKCVITQEEFDHKKAELLK